MVQLRSALEDLARIRVDPDVPYPAWQHDEPVREALDGALRLRLLEWATSEQQKVLLVGAGWPRLAADFAERGSWVTVVDSDVERRRAVAADAGARRVLGRVTTYDDDYHQRTFDVSAFNVLVAWDSLHRYTELLPLLKKMVRELKAGGKVFVRSPVVADQPMQSTPRALLRSLLALLPAASRKVVAEDSFLMPCAYGLRADDFAARLCEHFVVHDTVRHHLLGTDAADLVAGAGLPLAGALGPIGRLDRRILWARPALARFMAVFGAKEKQLGRVFNVRSESEPGVARE